METASFEKIVLVKRKTRLEELVERFNTRGQAKFYLEHAGGDFSDYAQEDDAYHRSMETLQRSLDVGLKLQVVDRSLVPTFLFSSSDLVVAVGQDGLVANTAKYATPQPILGVNPDPGRWNGVLLPFTPPQVRRAVTTMLDGQARVQTVTLGEVALEDGQRLLAFNDFFLGSRSHVSARYRITADEHSEPQSSSGVLVSTGVGSTGWLSSTFNMAAGLAAFTGGTLGQPLRLAWDDPRLVYVVREPFLSQHSGISMVAGIISPNQELVIESLIPQGGVIFSDGIEQDYLEFNSGATAHVRASNTHAHLVIG
jgi:NAD kinase